MNDKQAEIITNILNNPQSKIEWIEKTQKDSTYKKLYFDLKEQFDKYCKHRSHCPTKCKYCRECYNEVITSTKKIKNKEIRANLLDLWKTLWLNNCNDFDIIVATFDAKVFR